MLGTGKSGVLNYATAWAYKKNWIVLKVPNCYHLTQPKSVYKKDEEITFQPYEKHVESRLFIDYVNSGRILNDFKSSNEAL